MNFKSLIVLGLGIATLGLSLPAHADTANVVEVEQKAIITGHGNVTGQSESTTIRNRETGPRRGSSTGSVVTKSQVADVEGDGNVTAQESKTAIRNERNNNYPPRYYRYYRY
jgi:hypothetical protein